MVIAPSAHVVVALDSFKGSVSAAQACAAFAGGLRQARPDVTVRELPIADGGEGTVDAAVAAGLVRREAIVTGPLGQPVRAEYAFGQGQAVIESASACGLHLLPELPSSQTVRAASSYGVGELIGLAIADGATQVVVGLGGTACVDGGVGLATALGVRLLDEGGRPLVSDARFTELRRLRRPTWDGAVQLVAAVDVNNPLLGSSGASHVFGPQKGASSLDVEELERGLCRWAKVVGDATGVDGARRPGMGAGGGIAFALTTLFGADVRSGADFVLDMLQFDAIVAQAAALVVGEGSLDAQSLEGKGPVTAARRAMHLGIPTTAVAGTNQLSESIARRFGITSIVTLEQLEPDRAESMRNASTLLQKLGGLFAAGFRAQIGPDGE